MSVRQIDNFKLDDDEVVKVKEMGRITELMYMQRSNETCSIIKLSDNEYIDKRTGCLLYTSPSPRDRTRSRMPSSA